VLNTDLDAIEVGGRDFAQSKKFRDVKRNGRAAIVIDDLASTDPWRPRGIEVRGRADAIEGPDAIIRIHPERIISWESIPRDASHAPPIFSATLDCCAPFGENTLCRT
jgi:pyridoxamine 5'-phosphate oxidase family protein